MFPAAGQCWENVMFRALYLLIFILLGPSIANAEKLSVTIDGYRSGEVTFKSVFSRIAPNDPKRLKLNEIIDHLVSAESNPSLGKFVVVVIIGHADRQDNVKQFPTSEARRESELQASNSRADDARDWLLEQVQKRLQAMGASPPSEFDSGRNIAVARFPSGAALLKHKVITGGEPQRMENRRVGFFLHTFPKD
jgi:hypothetical protein